MVDFFRRPFTCPFNVVSCRYFSTVCDLFLVISSFNSRTISIVTMTTVSATKRLCQGAKLFAPLSGRAPSYTTPLVLTNSNNNNHNHNNGFSACQLNSLASQFSVMRLSSSSASPILSSSSSFHSSAAVDGAKAKPMAVKIRPLEELPPVPKRPLTAWLEFCRINRPMVRRAQPTLGGPGSRGK